MIIDLNDNPIEPELNYDLERANCLQDLIICNTITKKINGIEYSKPQNSTSDKYIKCAQDGIQFTKEIKNINIRDKKDCLEALKNNGWFYKNNCRCSINYINLTLEEINITIKKCKEVLTDTSIRWREIKV